MKTVIALVTLLTATAAHACTAPAEQGEPACAYCEEFSALQLYYGPDVSQETPFLQSLQVKCNSECSPEASPSESTSSTD